MRIRNTKKTFIGLTVLGLTTVISLSTSAFADTKNFPRNILCIYDSSEAYEGKLDNSLTHAAAEMVLNHLGMKAKYHDIQKGLPKSEDLRNISGILTWFQDDEIPNAREYCLWAARQIQSGRRFIILDNLGAFRDSRTKETTPLDVVNRVYQSLGLEYEGSWTGNPFIIETVSKDSSMVEFERSLDKEVGIYAKLKSLDLKNKIYLQLNRTDISDGQSDVVVTTPYGALSFSSYTIFIDDDFGFKKWRINPFQFFEEGFDLAGKPRYDTTTILGRRIFYSHIDGDGFRNISEVEHAFCGEIIRDQILKKYPLPITVSFITSEIDSRYMGSRNLQNIAKSIFALPHVEAGVHTFTHPLDWGEQYTVFPINGYSEKVVDETYAEKISQYTQSGFRVIVNPEKFIEREIKEAVEYTNRYLLPPGKKAEVFQWSGDCKPPAAAIAMTRSLGIRNINGGDTRFDRANPSYTGVAPLIRHIGNEIQFYTSNANENIYTNEWKGPFDWFDEIVETLQQTEYPTLVHTPPRRVTPINIYYHLYSGEKAASLSALKKAYDFVIKQNIIPLFTSEYISVVEGFLSGRIEATEDGGWRFSRYGSCRTIRFDNSKLFPDLVRSKNIIGFFHWHDVLYVYLNNADEAVLYLTDKSPIAPYLEEASNLLFDWTITVENGAFVTRGFDDGFYRLANMTRDTIYEVEVRDLNQQIINKEIFRSSPDGQLAIKLALQGKVFVSLLRRQKIM